MIKKVLIQWLAIEVGEMWWEQRKIISLLLLYLFLQTKLFGPLCYKGYSSWKTFHIQPQLPVKTFPSLGKDILSCISEHY